MARPASDPVGATAEQVSFAELGIPAPVVTALAARGITSPFPIQALTARDVLAGRDVLGRAQTGAGKTLAFGLPMLARLAPVAGAAPLRRGRAPRALVLLPTRELAAQVAGNLEPLAASLGLTTMTVYGGVPAARQHAALARGVDIVFACPGRTVDLLGDGSLVLNQVQITVLDEADHLADLGFLPSVRRLLDATPAGSQRLLFSATLDGEVDKLVRRYMQNPVLRSLSAAAAPVQQVEHHLLQVDATSKSALLVALARDGGAKVVFTRTKHGARKLTRQLVAAGLPAVELHGNLSQPQREKSLAALNCGQARILVATDIAARGIHIDGVSLVIHADPPVEHKAYLHRSGRTGRAGAAGTVVTVLTAEQSKDVVSMTRKAGLQLPVLPVTPSSAQVLTLATATA